MSSFVDRIFRKIKLSFLTPYAPKDLWFCPTVPHSSLRWFVAWGEKQHFCNLPRRGVQGQRRRCRRHRCAIGLVHLVGRLLQLHTARSGGFCATALPRVAAGSGRKEKLKIPQIMQVKESCLKFHHLST